MSVNIRQAILSAADQIERHPKSFNFIVGGVPKRDGEPGPNAYDGGDDGLRCVGCALGWISHFAAKQLPNGLKNYGGASFTVACRAMPELKPSIFPNGDAAHIFYNLMDKAAGCRCWRDYPAVCAQTMRKYADTYWPEQKAEAPVIPLKAWLADFVPGTGYGDLIPMDRETLRYIGYEVLSVRAA